MSIPLPEKEHSSPSGKKCWVSELMKEFDEVVTELLFLAMDEDSLKTRIEQLAKGGEAQ